MPSFGNLEVLFEADASFQHVDFPHEWSFYYLDIVLPGSFLIHFITNRFIQVCDGRFCVCLSWLYAPHFSTVGLVDSSRNPFGPIHIHFESAQVGLLGQLFLSNRSLLIPLSKKFFD